MGAEFQTTHQNAPRGAKQTHAPKRNGNNAQRERKRKPDQGDFSSSGGRRRIKTPNLLQLRRRRLRARAGRALCVFGFGSIFVQRRTLGQQRAARSPNIGNSARRKPRVFAISALCSVGIKFSPGARESIAIAQQHSKLPNWAPSYQAGRQPAAHASSGAAAEAAILRHPPAHHQHTLGSVRSLAGTGRARGARSLAGPRCLMWDAIIYTLRHLLTRLFSTPAAIIYQPKVSSQFRPQLFPLLVFVFPNCTATKCIFWGIHGPIFKFGLASTFNLGLDLHVLVFCDSKN